MVSPYVILCDTFLIEKILLCLTKQNSITFTSKKADDKYVCEYLCGIVVLYSGAFYGFLAWQWGQNIPPLCLPPLLPVFVVCSNSSGDGGVGEGEWSCTIECRMASSSSESVAVCVGPLLHSPSPCYITHQHPASAGHDCNSVISQWYRAAEELCYLDLRASRQEGRYLSNSMVRLAFSDWTSLLSIQLDTDGFQPRSAGFMYRMPEEKNREYNISCDSSTNMAAWFWIQNASSQHFLDGLVSLASC